MSLSVCVCVSVSVVVLGLGLEGQVLVNNTGFCVVCVFVCVFVCPRTYLRNFTSDFRQFFCACYAWPCTLCNSGLMDDAIFPHKPRYLDVAAKLKRSAHAA